MPAVHLRNPQRYCRVSCVSSAQLPLQVGVGNQLNSEQVLPHSLLSFSVELFFFFFNFWILSVSTFLINVKIF